ncbi:MAG: hypothetical protein JWO58_2203 [Chitinophagaceae bacterium]|nr:hypothetical protein [Chitinophagaceae bacterium]
MEQIQQRMIRLFYFVAIACLFITGHITSAKTFINTDVIAKTRVTIIKGSQVALTLTSSSSNVSCASGRDGSASITNIQGGTAPYTYSWSPSGGTEATAVGLVKGNYTVIVTDANGVQANATFNITEPLAITVSFSSINETCVPGNDGSAAVHAEGGTGSYSYLWSNESTSDSIFSIPAGLYSVTIEDELNCEATYSIMVGHSTDPVIRVSDPVVICKEESANLDASGGNSYSWDHAAGNTASVTVAPDTTTVYSVVVTDQHGCESTGQVTVTVNTPIASFNTSNSGNDVFFTNTSSSYGTSSYSWNFGDGSAIDHDQSPTHNYGSGASYVVTLKLSNECGMDSISQTISTDVTAMKSASQMELTIKPNPSSGRFALSYENNTSIPSIVSVMDMQGRAIYSYNSSSIAEEQVDLSFLQKGIYSFHVQKGNQVGTELIVIQ